MVAKLGILSLSQSVEIVGDPKLGSKHRLDLRVLELYARRLSDAKDVVETKFCADFVWERQ